MKHSFSCLLYYILVFGYQIKHPFSCLSYYFSGTGVWISDETPFSVLGYLVFNLLLVFLTEPRAVLQTRVFSSFIFLRFSLISSLISLSFLAAIASGSLLLPLITGNPNWERRSLLMISLVWKSDSAYNEKATNKTFAANAHLATTPWIFLASHANALTGLRQFKERET